MAISALIQEIDSLEATIAAAQARLQELKSAETFASSALEQLKAAYNLISGVAPSAIDSLKEVAMSVFGGINTSSTPTTTVDVPVAQQPEPLIETPIETPDSEHLKAPVQVENEAEFQEKEELAATVQVKRATPTGRYEIIKVSEAVSYCLNIEENLIQCAYAGFNNKSRAEQWGKYLISKGIIKSFEIRLAQRIEGYKYELKMWNISTEALKTLSRKDLAEAPRKGFNSTSTSSTETIPAISEAEARESLGFPSPTLISTATATEEEEYYIGDWVTYQDESLEILEVYRDGTLILQSPEGTLEAHSSEVELGFRKPKNWHPFS